MGNRSGEATRSRRHPALLSLVVVCWVFFVAAAAVGSVLALNQSSAIGETKQNVSSSSSALAEARSAASAAHQQLSSAQSQAAAEESAASDIKPLGTVFSDRDIAGMKWYSTIKPLQWNADAADQEADLALAILQSANQAVTRAQDNSTLVITVVAAVSGALVVAAIVLSVALARVRTWPEARIPAAENRLRPLPQRMRPPGRSPTGTLVHTLIAPPFLMMPSASPSFPALSASSSGFI